MGYATGAIVAALVCAPSALAVVPTTYTVGTLDDSSSGSCGAPVGSTESCTTLRAAVTAANDNGGNPTISLGAGRYVLGGTGGASDPLEIDVPMTIEGAGSASTTTVQTDGPEAVVDADVSSIGATIEDLEITGGSESGIFDDGTLTGTGSARKLGKLGSASFTLAPGHKRSIGLKLHGRKALKELERRHGLAATATVSYWDLGRYVSTGRKVKLVPASEHPRRK